MHCIIYEQKILTESIRHGSIAKPIWNGMDEIFRFIELANKYVL